MQSTAEMAAALAADRIKGLSIKEMLSRHPEVSAAELLRLLQALSPQATALKALVDGGMKLDDAILEVDGLTEAHIREYIAANADGEIPEAVVTKRGRGRRQSDPTPRSQGVRHGAAAPRNGHQEMEDPGGAAIRKRLVAGQRTARRR